MVGLRGVYRMTDAEKMANILDAFEILKEIELQLREIVKGKKKASIPDAIMFATICCIIADTDIPDITIVTDSPINDNEIIGMA